MFGTKGRGCLKEGGCIEVFTVLRENRNIITGVTFWNVSDKDTWLDHYPVEGRRNYPLLFDQYLQPKKAYLEVVNF